MRVFEYDGAVRMIVSSMLSSLSTIHLFFALSEICSGKD